MSTSPETETRADRGPRGNGKGCAVPALGVGIRSAKTLIRRSDRLQNGE